MRNVHKYQAHPWGSEVWFTQDDAALRKLAKRFGLNLASQEGADGLCWSTPGPWVIWVRPGVGHGPLVHECSHAALDILDSVGIDAHSADGEPMCYTLQRMVERFLPHLLPQSS